MLPILTSWLSPTPSSVPSFCMHQDSRQKGGPRKWKTERALSFFSADGNMGSGPKHTVCCSHSPKNTVYSPAEQNLEMSEACTISAHRHRLVLTASASLGIHACIGTMISWC